MSSTSKLNQQKPKKLKFIPKPNKQWEVKQSTRNWLELPTDIMANILYRICVHDKLENAQKVCTAWRKICKDPAMWRVIYMDAVFPLFDCDKARAMCKHAVDRSQGQLIDITIGGFCDDELLLYVAERSIKLRRLKIVYCYYSYSHRSLTEALKKFSLLEELSLYVTQISKESIETAGRYCLSLKTLKVNQDIWRSLGGVTETIAKYNEMAIAIGENLHELEHLELIGHSMSSIGLQVILDGCCQLKSLDLRRCFFIDLKGDLGKRCLEQIKCLKLPNDSLEGCPCFYKDGSVYGDFTAYSDDDF